MRGGAGCDCQCAAVHHGRRRHVLHETAQSAVEFNFELAKSSQVVVFAAEFSDAFGVGHGCKLSFQQRGRGGGAAVDLGPQSE